MPTSTLSVLPFVLLLSGCAANGLVTVKNRTDDRITVTFTTDVISEYDRDGDGVIDERDHRYPQSTIVIAPGDEHTIQVEAILWQAEMQIEYQGLTRWYEAHLDGVDMDTIWVQQSDFLCGNG